MALVRCEFHGLLYNTDNPRGCPACDQDKKGRRGEAAMMKELARASRKTDRPSEARSKGTKAVSLDRSSWSGRPDRRRLLILGIVLAGGLTAALFSLSKPRYIEQQHPNRGNGIVRPLALTPGQPVSVLFSMLGTQPPRTHPTDPAVERYSYGTALYVDAINSTVYSIDIGVANRSWRGLSVGLGETEVEGKLALLSEPIRTAARGTSTPVVVSGYLTFPSVDDRPTFSLIAEVRPPNGCFDVTVDMQPMSQGVLVRSGRRLAVVGEEGDPLNWVVTNIRVADRHRQGPLNTRVC